MASVIDPGTPNRVGLRYGQISELTILVPLKAGGVESLRAKLKTVDNGSGRAATGDRRWGSLATSRPGLLS